MLAMSAGPERRCFKSEENVAMRMQGYVPVDIEVGYLESMSRGS